MLGWCIAAASVLGSLQTPVREAQATRTGTAVIAGRVVSADSQQPLRRVQVKLTSPNLGRDGRTTSTDSDGTYEFTDLPAGRYTLSAQRGGYLTLQYGQRRPLEQGTPLPLADRQVADHIDFALPRMSVINGQISDEEREPIAGVDVYAMRFAFWQGARRLVPAGVRVVTDDDGQYRLVGLTPGTYIVLARSRDKWTMVDAGRTVTMAYAPTYFPGTGRVGDATRIALGTGKTASADFTVIPERTARITGTIVTSQGRPVDNVVLIQETIGPTGGSVGIASSATVAPDGTFTLRDVAPGEYKLQASRDRELLTQPMTVDGADIENVALTTSAGWSVRGTITTESGAAPSISVARVRVGARPLVITGMRMVGVSDGGPPVVKDDWTFFTPGSPGAARLVVTLPPGWALKSILMGDREIADVPLDPESGEELTGVRVIITDRVATVEGQIADESDFPAVGATAILFPVDRTKWYDGSRLIRNARTDQKGHYKLEGVLPGEYFATAVDYVEQDEWNDPDYLEPLREHAQRLTIAAGDSRNIVLKVVKQ